MSFTRYPDYKDSGVKWLSSIPRLWEFKRINMIASLNDDALPETTDGEQEITYVDIGSVSLSAGVEKFEVFTFKDAPSRARRKVKDGDVIISTVRTYLKAIAPILNPPENLVVSTGFAVLRSKSDVKSSFTKYALQSNGFLDEIISRSTGVSYPAINASEIGFIKIPVPSLSEQTQIANFLDQETTKIDALVTEKQKLIELLKEKRQAVISHAVTKGLKPKVNMKDSGVDWLGEIPEHWYISRFCYETWVRARLGWKGLKADEYVDEGYIFLATPNIKESEIDFTNVNYISLERYEESPEIMLAEGDILLTKDGSTLGTVNLVRELPKAATVNSSIAVITPKKNLSSEFLLYLFKSSYIENIIQLLKGGMGVPHLFQGDINKIHIPIPPLEDQVAIAKFLKSNTENLEKLIALSKNQIRLLTERRSVLISAAVTGQIDVRNYQPKEVA